MIATCIYAICKCRRGGCFPHNKEKKKRGYVHKIKEIKIMADFPRVILLRLHKGEGGGMLSTQRKKEKDDMYTKMKRAR